jgi:hypothetical protein
MGYTKEAANVLSVISRKGTTLTMTYDVPGTRDEVTETVTGGGTKAVKVKALILDGKSTPNASYEERTNIRQNCRTLYVAGKSLPGLKEVPPGAVFRFLGVDWVAEGGTVLMPDGVTPILHTVYVKR